MCNDKEFCTEINLSIVFYPRFPELYAVAYDGLRLVMRPKTDTSTHLATNSSCM